MPGTDLRDLLLHRMPKFLPKSASPHTRDTRDGPIVLIRPYARPDPTDNIQSVPILLTKNAIAILDSISTTAANCT